MEAGLCGLGRSRDQLTAYLANLIRTMKPQQGGDRAAGPVVEVLDTLHNASKRNEPSDFPYYDAFSGATRRYWFSLLTFGREDDN